MKRKVYEEKIAVALSGGRDSTVALHQTLEKCENSLNKKFYCAIIIDHNMRKESYLEARQVKQYWKLKGVKVVILRNRNRKLLNQKQAREFRLNMLSFFALKNNINTIVLGHNLEDKIETYLLRKEKFSEFMGLCSISDITYINTIKFFRPLLHTSRSYIDFYVRKYGLFFVEDSSNATDKYRRNAIRHSLLPSVNKREILDVIYKNIEKRKYLEKEVLKWILLHLVKVHNFQYKFLWNRLPVDKLLSAGIFYYIVHKIRGKAPILSHIHMNKILNSICNFHINNVNFERRGDYCYVQEYLSDQEMHMGQYLIFNYKIFFWSVNKKPLSIQNVQWPLIKINGILYDFSITPQQTENFFFKILERNYLTLY
jgi:tRNA(Ile)-lysidine synthetase-like protein